MVAAGSRRRIGALRKDDSAIAAPIGLLLLLVGGLIAAWGVTMVYGDVTRGQTPGAFGVGVIVFGIFIGIAGAKWG